MTTTKHSLRGFFLTPLAALLVCLPASARQVSSGGSQPKDLSTSHIGNAFAGIDLSTLRSWDPRRIFRDLPGSTSSQPIVIGTSSGPFSSCFQLVWNGGFEFGTIPTGLAQLSNSLSWFDGNAATADYFAVGGGAGSGVPTNYFGTRTPHGGNAYAGLFTYASYLYREYLETTLLSTMTKDKTYNVSFWAARADGGTSSASLATDHLGVKFSPTSVYQANVLNLTGATWQTKKVLVSTDWVRLGFYYRAKGDENFMIIGNFNDDQGTTVQTLGTGTAAYYYIDDVSVICTPTKDRM